MFKIVATRTILIRDVSGAAEKHCSSRMFISYIDSYDKLGDSDLTLSPKFIKEAMKLVIE